MNALTVARLNLRLNRAFLLSWLVPLWSIPILFIPSYKNYYPELGDRATLVHGMRVNLGMRAMYGEVYEPGTLGQLISWEGAGWLTILSAVMSVLLLFRCYRKPESSSLGELPRATGMHPLDIAAGALILIVGVAIALGAGITAILLALKHFYGEIDTRGCVGYGCAIALSTLASALLAGCVSLLSGSETTKLGMLTLGAGFMVRAAGDIEHSDTIRWLTPLGWMGIVRPFTDDNWWALAAAATITGVLALLWLAGERGRQYGFGILPTRTHRARKQRRIATPWGLRRLLDRSFRLTWLLTGFILAFFMNSLSASMDELLTQDDKTGQIFKQMFSETDLEIAFITYLADFLGILLGVAAVAGMLKLRSEERNRTVDLMRSRGVSRTLPMALQAGSTVLFIVESCLATGIGAILGVSRDAWPVALSANLTQFAPMFALAGLTTLIIGLTSRYGWLAWLPIIYSGAMTIIGPLLKAPEWLLNTSVFGHAINSENTGNLAAWLALVAVGGIAIVGGVVLAGRREVL